MLHRVQVTDTSQHQLFRGDSGFHGQIAVKKPLIKDTNNKKRRAWAKNHKQWTLDRWKSVLLSDEGFDANCRVFVRRRAGEWMISACVFPTVKHGGEGGMV